MKTRRRLIAILVCCALLLGGTVVSLRSLPLLPRAAAQLAAIDLKAGSFDSHVWEGPTDAQSYRKLVAGLSEAGFVLQSVKVVSVDSGTVTLEWHGVGPVRAGGREGAHPQSCVYQPQARLSRRWALRKVYLDQSSDHPDLEHGHRLRAQPPRGSRGRILGAG